ECDHQQEWDWRQYRHSQGLKERHECDGPAISNRSRAHCKSSDTDTDCEGDGSEGISTDSTVGPQTERAHRSTGSVTKRASPLSLSIQGDPHYLCGRDGPRSLDCHPRGRQPRARWVLARRLWPVGVEANDMEGMEKGGIGPAIGDFELAA